MVSKIDSSTSFSRIFQCLYTWLQSTLTLLPLDWFSCEVVKDVWISLISLLSAAVIYLRTLYSSSDLSKRVYLTVTFSRPGLKTTPILKSYWIYCDWFWKTGPMSETVCYKYVNTLLIFVTSTKWIYSSWCKHLEHNHRTLDILTTSV